MLIETSPGSGYELALPATRLLPRRRISPPTQPRPSSITVCGVVASPWKNTAAFPVRFVPVSTNVSPETLAVPLAARCPPAGNTEFAQPLPAAPLLPHGQGTTEPSPKQNGIGGGTRSVAYE